MICVIFQVKADHLEVVTFWIKPVKLGYMPITITAVTPTVTDGLKRMLLVVVFIYLIIIVLDYALVFFCNDKLTLVLP